VVSDLRRPGVGPRENRSIAKWTFASNRHRAALRGQRHRAANRAETPPTKGTRRVPHAGRGIRDIAPARARPPAPRGRSPPRPREPARRRDPLRAGPCRQGAPTCRPAPHRWLQSSRPRSSIARHASWNSRSFAARRESGVRPLRHRDESSTHVSAAAGVLYCCAGLRGCVRNRRGAGRMDVSQPVRMLFGSIVLA
jgi:hypothetical protein